MKIHAPHLKSRYGAKFPHLHIKDKHGNTLNNNLESVNEKSPEAHIPVQNLAELILEVKPK